MIFSETALISTDVDEDIKIWWCSQKMMEMHKLVIRMAFQIFKESFCQIFYIMRSKTQFFRNISKISSCQVGKWFEKIDWHQFRLSDSTKNLKISAAFESLARKKFQQIIFSNSFFWNVGWKSEFYAAKWRYFETTKKTKCEVKKPCSESDEILSWFSAFKS